MSGVFSPISSLRPILFIFLNSNSTVKKLRSKRSLCAHHQNPTDQSIPSIKSNQTSHTHTHSHSQQDTQRESTQHNNKMSASSAAFSPDHHLSPSDQLCYVHCTFCDTVLAVSVPCTSLFKTVTVRCGHCSNLLSVNMRALLFPAANQLHFGHTFFNPQHLLEDIRSSTPSNMQMTNQPNPNETSIMPIHVGAEEIPKPPAVNRPPEKRQRVPSAYNRFIKDEIQRIKAGNPDISHREAFSAAAKNWAHFPHIHFGLMPDQPVKKTNIRQQEGEDMLVKDGYFTTPATANVGVSPY